MTMSAAARAPRNTTILAHESVPRAPIADEASLDARSYQHLDILERTGFNGDPIESHCFKNDRVNAALRWSRSERGRASPNKPNTRGLATGATSELHSYLGCAARGPLSMLGLHHRTTSTIPLMHQGCAYIQSARVGGITRSSCSIITSTTRLEHDHASLGD